MKRTYRGLRNRNPLGSTILATAAFIGASGMALAAPLELVICHIDDRSGAAADTGIESLNGLKMVIDPLNAAGGINGQKIKLITYDGKTDPQLTATFATRCAEDDKGLLIIGGSPSAPAQSMVPVATQYKIPYYIMAASTVDMKDAAWHFRFGPDGGQDGLAVADALNKAGINKIAVVNNSVPFGITSSQKLTEQLASTDIKIVTQQTYDINATDVSPQIINVMQADPQAIIVYPYPADGARVIRTIRQLGLDVPVIIPRVGMMKAFRELAAEAGDGVLVPASVDVTRPDVAKLFEDYGKLYGPLVPSPSPAQGHDAGEVAKKVLADPAVQAAVAAGNLAAAREAIRNATEQIGEYHGLQGTTAGPYTFSKGKHHGPPDKDFFVFMEVAEKGKALVTPDAKALSGK